jgi:hypothetical protein
MYNDRGPCLCPGFARKFNTAFECGSICRGMDNEFFKHMTAKSSEYMRMSMDERGELAGS